MFFRNRRSIIFTAGKKFLIKIHQEQFLRGTGAGCVKPAQKLGIYHFFSKVTLVYKYRVPLATLGLVAGNGVGKFYLQGIIVGVLF